MDRWKSRGGKSQRKRKSQTKEDAGARKGRKAAKHSVFPMICGTGGSKSRLAQAAGAERCGQMRDEQLHPVVARSTFGSQNVQNAPCSDHFWKLWCRKSARRFGAKHMWKLKCTKRTMLGPLLEVVMSKKCTPLWREAHLEVKMYKTPQCRSAFGSCDVEKVDAVVARSTFQSQNVKSSTCSYCFWAFQCRLTWQAHGICAPCQKWVKRQGFVSNFKNDGRHGTYAEDLAKCIPRGRRSTRHMFIRAVRRSGRWFPERGCILEHQIFSFGKMTLRDRCSTLYDLASLFRGRRSTLDRWSGKIAKRIGTRPSALHSTFHFWRKSRRIASFLMLSTSKNEEVSLTCFVFDVVKFKN